MEDFKKCNEIIKTIIGIVVIVIFVVVNVTMLFKFGSENKIFLISINIISVFSAILYCFIIIPITFSVLKIKEIKKCYYYLLPLVYTFFPVILLLQNDSQNISCIAFTTFLFSLGTAFCIYRIFNQAEKIDIKYMKFARFVVSTLLGIVCTFLELFYSNIDIKLLVFSASLLLILEIVYKKLDFDRSDKANDTQPPNAEQDMTILKPLINNTLVNTKKQVKLLEDSEKNLNACTEIVNKY